MRAEFKRLCHDYPRKPPYKDPTFTGHPVAKLLRSELPEALTRAVPSLVERYIVDGSAGDGTFTHTPWVAVLDPRVTTTVQEGLYIVYLLSLGGERLYLTLNQGCTKLKRSAGLPGARLELVRRRERLWPQIRPNARRLQPLHVDLNVEPNIWRGKLYELGAIAGVEYLPASLPPEAAMVADLQEAVRLYRNAIDQGGWASDDDIEREALDDRRLALGTALTQPPMDSKQADDAAFDPESVEDMCGRALRAIRIRRGQAQFRAALFDAYGGRCAITGCAVPDVLEAAHITPHRGPLTNHVTNGLLLRADLHTLFDCGLLAIHPETRKVVTADALAGSSYAKLANIPLRKPRDDATSPSKKSLQKRFDEFDQLRKGTQVLEGVASVVR